MRQQACVGQINQRLRHAGFIIKNIEARGGNCAVGEAFDQSTLINCGAAPDIDKYAVRAQSLQDRVS